MIEAVSYMEVEWNDKVVNTFNDQLANRYPFNPETQHRTRRSTHLTASSNPTACSTASISKT